MEGAKLFLPVEEVDKLIAAGKTKIEDGLIEVEGLEWSLRIEPAVYFERQVAGEADPFNLLGKTRRVAALPKEGLERFQNSVICGNCAYEVVEGFYLWWEPPETLDENRVVRASQKKEETTEAAKEEVSPEQILANLLLEKLK